MATAREKTALPNWAWSVLCFMLLGLLGFVYATVDRRIEDQAHEREKLERRLETQETFMKNTREQLIAHGWTVDNMGNISPPKR